MFERIAKSHPLRLFSLISTLCFAGFAWGQVSPGYPSFSGYDSHEIDTVNLLSNNVIINIPIMLKSGAFALDFRMTGNSYVYNPNGVWNTALQQSPLIGAANQFLAPNGIVTNTPVTNVLCPGSGTTTQYTNWTVLEANGTVHPLSVNDFSDRTAAGTSCLTGSGFTAQTIDGSGLTVTVPSNGIAASSVFDKSGAFLSVSEIQDSNSNLMFMEGGIITDTLGLPALSYGQLTTGPFTWTNVNDGSSQVTVSTSNLTLKTAFDCSDIGDINDSFTTPLVSALTFPDGTSVGINYETTPGNSPKVTGRFKTITLREGGTITYTYGGTNSGINCTYQTVPTLTRTLGNGDITTYTLMYNQYPGNPDGYYAQNTVVDPGGNTNIYTFSGFLSSGTNPTVGQLLTQVQHYQGASALLTTDAYCYNASFSDCNKSTANPLYDTFLPVTSLVQFHQINGMTARSATEIHYDNYGNVTYLAQYDFGTTSPTHATTTVYGTWNGTSCVSIGNNVNNKPCQVLSQGTSNSNTYTIAESRFSYDSHGNLLATYAWNGMTWLSNSTANVYNSNGTLAKAFDLANNETDYTYSPGGYYMSSADGITSCSTCTNYPFPTSIKNVGTGLTTTATWDATGGVKLTDADANGNTTRYCYTTGSGCSGGTADPFWRPLSVTDPLGNLANKTYPSGSSPDLINGSFTFNSSSSVENVTSISDPYARPTNKQIQQSPSSTAYDTASTQYSWNGNYQQIQTTQPCSTALKGQCSFSSATSTSLIDPLGRAYTVTDGGGGVVKKTYTQNDVLTVLTPAPSGENNKQFQRQYDGLGRLSMVCAIGNGSTTACGQNTGSANGVTTSYAYTYASGSSTSSVTRGSQTRTSTVDGMGRVAQGVTPEGNTTAYVYDVLPSWCGGHAASYSGKLIGSQKTGTGNAVCYAYDSLGRTVTITAISGSNGATECRRFYYDNSTGALGTIPSGISVANPYGRMVEAETDNCTLPITTSAMITDEWFSYDQDGRTADMWELTPHSGQYYHSHATFYGNGKVNTLQLASPSLYTLTYGLDGEGRWNTLTDTTTSFKLVTGATFPPAATCTVSGKSVPCSVISLTGADNDTYAFDPNTYRMTEYEFKVGTESMTGSLTWNPNGTLNQLVIVDGFNSGGTQTCNYNSTAATQTGYDDWGRLVGVDCGSGQWGQIFSYDIYDNLTKSLYPASGRTGTTWNPGYSPSNNHCNICSYNADGDVTADSNDVYGWDAFNKLASTATSGTPTCGSSGRCLTYDAFGRIVEQSTGSTFYERWITQLGETAYMSANTPEYAYWPAPGGQGKVIIVGTTSYDYMHSDWLGNARITSGLTTHTAGTDQAFSPYGEIYDIFGSNSGEFKTFAGLTGNFDPTTTTPVMWDTPNRELSMVGRWLSPDPAGAGWNQYAYTTNPNGLVDPSGLRDCKPTNGIHCLPVNNPLGDSLISPAIGQSEAFFYGAGSGFGTVGADSTTYYDSNGNPYGYVTAAIISYQEVTEDAWITLPSWLGAPSEPGWDLMMGTFNAPGAALNDTVCSGDPVCTMILGVGLAASGLGEEEGTLIEDEALSDEIAAGSRGMSIDFGGIFESETNTAGGTVWSSTGNVGQGDVGNIVNSTMIADPDSEINIITGAHGLPNGDTIADPSMYQDDLDYFGSMPNVNVYNFNEMTSAEVNAIANGPGTTIFAFCNSGACKP